METENLSRDSLVLFFTLCFSHNESSISIAKIPGVVPSMYDAAGDAVGWSHLRKSERNTSS